MLTASLLLHIPAFAAWALAMDRHHCDVFGNAPGRARRALLRALGLAVSVGSLLLLPLGDRFGIALAQWTLAASLGACLVTAVLTWCARWLVLIAVVAANVAIGIAAAIVR